MRARRAARMGGDMASTTQLELRTALDACADAEWSGSANKRELYRAAMLAFRANNPHVPKHDVCRLTMRAIGNRMWEKYGRKQGRPRQDFDIAPTWIRSVGHELGFTDRRMARPKGDTTATSFIAKNKRWIAALNNMAEGNEACRRLMRTHDALEHVEREVLESLEAEGVAMRDNARDVLNDRIAVPKNLQSTFLDCLASAASVSGLLRMFGMSTKAKKWGERPRMSAKGVSNVRQGHTSHVPACLEPQSAVAAQWRGYHGAPCPECGTRRCVLSTTPGRLRCLRCSTGAGDGTFTAPEPMRCPHCAIDLAAERGMRDPCPNCGGATRIPHALR